MDVTNVAAAGRFRAGSRFQTMAKTRVVNVADDPIYEVTAPDVTLAIDGE